MNDEINEAQVHDMYCRFVMNKVMKAKYGELNGNPVIGLSRVKYSFESELKGMTLVHHLEYEDRIEAKSKDGTTYLFLIEE